MSEDIKQIKVTVNTEGMQAIMQNLEEKKAENLQLIKDKESLERELEAQKVANQGNGEGTIPMQPDQIEQEGNGGKQGKYMEFPDRESMYAYAKIHNPKAFVELQKKSFDAIVDSHLPFEFTDKLESTDENHGCRSLIGRMLDRQNIELRRKKGAK